MYFNYLVNKIIEKVWFFKFLNSSINLSYDFSLQRMQKIYFLNKLLTENLQFLQIKFVCDYYFQFSMLSMNKSIELKIVNHHFYKVYARKIVLFFSFEVKAFLKDLLVQKKRFPPKLLLFHQVYPAKPKSINKVWLP